MRTVVGRLLRHYRSMSQPDGGEWRALRERRKPADEEWAVAKARFTSGVVATVVVLSHHPFGFFVDLGAPISHGCPRLAVVGFPCDWCPASIRYARKCHDPLHPGGFAFLERLARCSGLIGMVIGPEVDQFFFGEFMWRHIAAKRLACGECPGVD